MTINRNNCESFFLDYYEGNLSTVDVAEMLIFLEENSDLKIVFESYERMSLKNEFLSFPEKEMLKKKYSAEGINALLSSEVSSANREEYFVAYIEDLLSSEQNEKITSFLKENPDFKKEFELFKRCKLMDEKVLFSEKMLLKRETITEQNREEYFVRATEGELSFAEKQTLEVFLIKYPKYKNEYGLFLKTKLVSEKVIFNEKSLLKRKEKNPIVRTMYYYYSAAASILLLVGLFFIFNNNSAPEKHLTDSGFSEKINNVKNTKNIKSEIQEPAVENDKRQNKKQTPAIVAVHRQKDTSVVVINKNSIQHEPQITEETSDEILTAQQINGNELLAEKINEIIAQNTVQQEAKKETAVIRMDTVSLVASVFYTEDEYQTISAVVKQKIRSYLGLQNQTDCSDPSKLQLWDLAMIAKEGIQKIIGKNVIDIEKVCDGTWEKMEYIFVAGNFEISKSITK